MRIIDESLIPSGDAAYFKQGTWTHLQKAYKEALDSLAQAIIKDYDNTKVYILYGCVATGTDPGARTFTAGAVYFNGEVYLVPAASFTSTGANVALGNIVVANNTTDYSVDPQITPGGASISIHKIRTIVITAGTAGSGDVDDFEDWLDAGVAHKGAYIDKSASVTLGSGFSNVSGAPIYYEYEDGTVLITALLKYSGSKAAGITILSGISAEQVGLVNYAVCLLSGDTDQEGFVYKTPFITDIVSGTQGLPDLTSGGTDTTMTFTLSYKK